MVTTIRRPNLRSIALPAEHGGWGFLLEPIILGLLVAPSIRAVLIAVAAISFFLVHQPLKLAIKDHRKKRRVLRTAWAEKFAIGYGLAGSIAFLSVLLTSPLSFVIPLMIGSIFGLVQLIYDSQNKSRHIIPQLCGAAALASTVMAITLLSGWSWLAALMLWLLLVVRAITSILYVRARLRLEYGKTYSAALVHGTHVFSLLLIVTLAGRDLIPELVLIPFILLTCRAFYGLSPWRKSVQPKVVGFSELAYGIITILIIAIGYTSSGASLL